MVSKGVDDDVGGGDSHLVLVVEKRRRMSHGDGGFTDWKIGDGDTGGGNADTSDGMMYESRRDD